MLKVFDEIQAMVLDPATAVPREVQKLSEQIHTQRNTVRDLEAKLARKFFKGDLEFQVEMANSELKRLEETYDDLDLGFQPSKSWTFPEIDQTINSLIQKLVGKLTEAASNIVQEAPLLPLSIFGGAPLQGGKLSLLKACKLVLDLNVLQLRRRELWTAYLEEVSTWSEANINAEIQKRQRDVSLIPTFKEVPGVNFSPLQTPMLEQKRFLEDVQIDLQAVLKKPRHTPHIPPPRESDGDILRKIDRLYQEMEEKLKITREEMHKDMKKHYGKLIDAERKKL